MTSQACSSFGAVLLAVGILSTQLTAHQRPTFASGVNTVRIDVLVKDAGGVVSGLTVDDFELTDNGVVQRPSLVEDDATPLNIYLAFDTSASLTRERLKSFDLSARSLVDSLRSVDRVSLVTFNHRVSLQSALTRDAGQLTASLARVSPSGGTALRDATFITLTMRESDISRALLMLFSDGDDTASWLTEAKVLEAARRSDVVVYPVAPFDPRRHLGPRTTWVDPFARGFMRELINDTGGRALEAPEDGDMRKVFTEIVNEFQRRYLLVYVPTNVADVGWHDVVVKLKHRRGAVTARRGYFAGR